MKETRKNKKKCRKIFQFTDTSSKIISNITYAALALATIALNASG